jgi:glycosyltransferase involved in cell wall biosynthesis
VLHVITQLDAGAGGNTLMSATGMDRTRYETWIAGGPGGPLWATARRAGVHVVELPHLHRDVSAVEDMRTLIELVSLIRRERFAIVHVHSAKSGVLGRLAALVCRVPVIIYTLHGRDPWWPAPDCSASQLRDALPGTARIFLAIERSLRAATDRFIAVAPTVARDAVLARIATPGKVDVAASAVDLDSIPLGSPAWLRDELGLPRDAPVVGTVGRLDAQKAPLDFVRMAAEVARTRPHSRFVMVGDGELAGDVEELARNLGVSVLLTGYRPDAAQLAAVFDVFVISSLYEGVGRAVTEAMASGRPVIATAVDGVVDIVIPGATGLLADARDPVGLAERVNWMLDHPAEAAQMGEQACALVRELFSANRMCTALDDVYSAALGLVPLEPAWPRASAVAGTAASSGSLANR